GRMRMDDGANLRPGLIDGQVHEDFAGALALAFKLFAFEVDDTDIIGLEVALADAGRRTQHAVVAHTEGMIAFVASAKALEPDAPADVAHLIFEFPFADFVSWHKKYSVGCDSSHNC